MVSFPQVSPYNPCIQLSSPPNSLHAPPISFSIFITRRILGEKHRSLSSSLGSFLHSHYLVSLRPKYSLQHPILKHPHPTFLPQCQRPSFTPIQKTGRIIVLYILIFKCIIIIIIIIIIVWFADDWRDVRCKQFRVTALRWDGEPLLHDI